MLLRAECLKSAVKEGKFAIFGSLEMNFPHHMQRLDTRHFLAQASGQVVLDVRTPAEYEQGHIPGALNFPLFSNEERVEVGTLYKQVSRESALLRGLEFVGPRMADMVRRAGELAPEKEVFVHCWRGGQRSESVAWLLQTAGFSVTVLEGGYKAFRRHVLDELGALPHALLVLGGPTGSGKTELLRIMQEQGAQVVDLEGLARHKGSAFGSLGEEDQPSTEQFENDLHDRFAALDPGRPVWIEHESRGIGRVFLPDPFWRYLMDSPLVLVDPGREARLDHAVSGYGHFEPTELKACFTRIQNRMGGQHVKAALEAIDRGDIRQAASLALDYYDKTYSHHLQKYPHSLVRKISIEGLEREEAARLLIQREKTLLHE
jgi:tRNA 2-selenouridine synthase